MQLWHWGRRAMHTARPWRTIRWQKLLDSLGGIRSRSPGQLQQLFHGTGHPAPIVPQQHLGRQDDVPGLGPEKAGGVDIALHLRHVRPGQGLQGGEPGVKGGGDLIHPLVGTLGGQTHGKQQLIILFILQGTQAVGIEGFQLLHDGPYLLRCFSHGGSDSFSLKLFRL